jgi:hypothetical protein
MKHNQIPSWKAFDDIYTPMKGQSGVIQDLAVESIFIDIHKPTHVVEMGTLHAQWPIFLEQVLTYKPNKYTLIDTFLGGEWDRDLSVEENKEILNNIIKDSKVIFNYELLTENDTSVINPNYDVFRYDGYSNYKVFEDYINRADEKSLIFIHDYAVNEELGTIFYSLKYANENNFYPVWFGNMSCLWTKNKEYKQHLLKTFESMYNIVELENSWLKTGYRPPWSWEGSDMQYNTFEDALVTKR